MRPPQIKLAALLEQSHPTVDLRLNDYEDSTRSFLDSVSAYKSRAMQVIADRTTSHVAETRRILEKLKAIEAETDQCKLKEIEMLAETQREQEESKEVELSVAAYERQLATVGGRVDDTEAFYTNFREAYDNLRKERDKDRTILSEFASTADPTLRFFQSLLGYTIEGLSKGRVLIRLTQIDPSDPLREFSFVLDVSSQLFLVPTTSPALPSMASLVDELNNTKDMTQFILQVRQAYQRSVRTSS